MSAATALDHPLASLDSLPEPAGPPRSVSVVVCTRDRPDQLRRCLASLSAMAGAPTRCSSSTTPRATDETQRTVAAFPGVRYVREPQPGLSCARNTGIRVSRGEVIAFVDDDVVVHPSWMPRLVAALDRPRAMAATGLVLPDELATPAQAAAELMTGWLGRGYEPAIFDKAFLEHAGRRPAPVWQIGAGANMAIRREAFRRVGLFDERLGAGRAGCSEDSEFWYRLLAAGLECRYEPTAVVFHTHRREPEAFCRQAREYMRGHTAALFIQFARHRHLGNLRQAFLTLPRYYLGRLVRDVRPSRPKLVRACTLAELRGFLLGLLFFPLALVPTPHGRRRLRPFLRDNPFPHPFTEGFFYREKMRAIHRTAPDNAVVDVLEVGGGRSGLTRMLYPEALVTNVDRDASLADAPPNLDPRVRFVHGDAADLPFEDTSFDLVTMFDLLEHVEDDRTAVREALRVLRPGGWLLITSPNEHWRFPFYRPMRRICPSEADMLAAMGPCAPRLFARRASAASRSRAGADGRIHLARNGRLPRPRLLEAPRPGPPAALRTARARHLDRVLAPAPLDTRHRDRLVLAKARLMDDSIDAPRVALLHWGDLIEDFLEPIGLSFEDFRDGMTGGWMFGYVDALQRAGVETVVFCITAEVGRPEKHRHRDTGAEIWRLPASRAYLALRRHAMGTPKPQRGAARASSPAACAISCDSASLGRPHPQGGALPRGPLPGLRAPAFRCLRPPGPDDRPAGLRHLPGR